MAPEKNSQGRGSVLPTPQIGPWTFGWMVIAGLLGLASFIYGIYEADDLFFWASFWIWGAALVPVLFSIVYMALENLLRSTTVVLAIMGVVGLAAGGFLLSRADSEFLKSILQNRNFIIFAIVVSLCITLAVAIFVAARVMMSYFQDSNEQSIKRLEVERELDLEELDASKTVDLRKLELESQARMKELDIEHERVKIELHRVDLEYQRENLLEHDGTKEEK